MNAGEQLIEQGRAEGRAAGLAEGLAEGRAEGFRAALREALAARGIALSDLGRARLGACRDMVTLQRWHVRAVTAGTEAEIFAEDKGQ